MTARISTLGELLDNAHTSWRVYDIGRKIQKLDKSTFAAIENGTQAYPAPLQQHAHIAIEFWQVSGSASPFIWFLKLPVDEVGKLVLASRDHFAQMVLEAVGTEISGEKGEELNNNPYVFTPHANKLAAMNARIKVELKQPASSYYEHTALYFSGRIGFDNWQAIAVQGLADFANRLNADNNEAHLIKALPDLPNDVFTPLCAQLEHIQISTALTEQLMHIALNNADPIRQIAALRGMASSRAEGIQNQVIDALLTRTPSLDILMVIAGRMWHNLREPARLYQFMECAAQEPQVFSGLFADLVGIAALRPHVLGMLRDESRSEALSRAIGQLFKTS